MTHNGESASSEQKNEKLRLAAQITTSWVNISGIKPMIDDRKPKMIRSRRERKRLPVTLKRQSDSMPPTAVPTVPPSNTTVEKIAVLVRSMP